MSAATDAKERLLDNKFEGHIYSFLTKAPYFGDLVRLSNYPNYDVLTYKFPDQSIVEVTEYRTPGKVVESYSVLVK